MDITVLPTTYAFLDLLVMGIGLATSAAGLFGSSSAAEDQEEAQAAYAAQQNRISAQQARIQRQITQESIQNERLRRQQMTQEYAHSQLQAYRQMQQRQAGAESTAASQGMGFSSAFSGATAANIGSYAYGTTQNYQSYQRGLEMFRNNMQILRYQNRIAQLGTQANQNQANFQTTSMQNQNDINFGNTLFSIGTGIMGNATTIANVGQAIPGYFSGPMGSPAPFNTAGGSNAVIR